ncbi:MAG: fused MFS/spermidine synthase [Fimbriimonadaceae bacterium]|nr:fused MFS/spermidine synthase [Fimbriimonadaceae bacterium]
MSLITLNTGMFIAETHTEAAVWQFTVEEMLVAGKTQYQEYQICNIPRFGKTLFLDFKIQSSILDEYVFHECMAQPAMTLHPNPRKVMVAGGGEGATLREALRHNTVDEAVMVDIDEELVDMVKEHMPEWHQGAFDDPRTTLLHTDARKYLQENRGAGFDVVLSDLPDPLEGGPAIYLFTKEYFQIAADAMSDDGVFAMQAGCANCNYPYLFASCMKTLQDMKETFPYVAGYFGIVSTFFMPWGFIVASKKENPLNLTVEEIARRHAARGVQNRYYTPRFHQGAFTLPEYLLEAVEEHGRVLTDAEPYIWTA